MPAYAEVPFEQRLRPLALHFTGPHWAGPDRDASIVRVEPSAPGPAHELKSVDPANEEATEAWNGVLFDRFVAFREIVTSGLGAHGERALATYPP